LRSDREKNAVSKDRKIKSEQDARQEGAPTLRSETHELVLYHFCRLQLPSIALSQASYSQHLRRTFALYQAKAANGVHWDWYLDNLYALDWFLAAGCLEGLQKAWEYLFAARSGRSDCLLIDALRARAVRLYPRNEERQENAVAEFWTHLLISESPGAIPIMARYDGQRPLIPWLIRVFQNWHISQLRHRDMPGPLPEDDLAYSLPAEVDSRWHEAFCLAARDHFQELADTEVLILGLRLRYRMSQREVAHLLGVHEGTVSRQTSQLRDRCLDVIGRRLKEMGWIGDDLTAFVLNEMAGLLLDEPRLSADNLAKLLAGRGKDVPQEMKRAGAVVPPDPDGS
jgi:RNA polymerase sigma factor (sigma-70 family)